MDVERGLISKALRTSTMELAVQKGIEPQHFIGPAVGEPGKAGYQPAPGEVWGWMMQHNRRYRSVPSMDLFRVIYPTFELWEPPDTLEAIVDQFVAAAFRRRGRELTLMLAKAVDDPAQALELDMRFQEAARQMSQLLPTTRVTRFSESLTRLELYRKRKETGVTPGISMGFQPLDDLTYGIQDYETCIIEGFLNIGKSTMGVKMAADAYFLRDQTPLMLSLEMEGEKLANKWDAAAADIRYRAIKRMELSPEEEERWYKIAVKADEARFEKDIIVIDDLYQPSIERIYAEVERWQPAFTIVDTIDEVRAPKHLRTVWEQQGYVARELKGISQQTRRAMVGIAQSGRDAEEKGATIGNIAGSIDIARKADMVIGLHASPEMQAMRQMEVRALKLRDDEGKGKTWKMYWDVKNWEFREWHDADAMRVKDAA